MLEKLVLWRHSHSEEYADHGAHHDHHEHREQASALLVLVGDSIHNALDGVLIGAAFLTDVRLGIVTGIAVMAHEIPQEIGDFAVLLHSGMSRGRALLLNLLTSLTSVVGGVVAYFGSAARMSCAPLRARRRRGLLPLRGRGRPHPRPAPPGQRPRKHHAGHADLPRDRRDRLGRAARALAFCEQDVPGTALRPRPNRRQNCWRFPA